ncbi:hypothetical protein AVEN_28669-1 [Araneus ventricosus]|uniref:Uncharacterized protein n=1 Tax=Araneus ventricosus TaxID=182803 RepID=A0A4Y2LC61_ARAVE|nr:hypothetical protein AVEN_28669-1 [Araneus ventricosus]
MVVVFVLPFKTDEVTLVVIGNRGFRVELGQMTRKTHELAPPQQTSHHTNGRTCSPLHVIYRATGPYTRRIFSGIGFEPRTRNRNLTFRQPWPYDICYTICTPKS